MIVSHAHKFIFMKTRKTGGTSVELALRQLCGDGDVITSTHADDEARFAGRGAQNYVFPLSRWPLRELWRRAKGDTTLRGRPGRALQEHMYASEVQAKLPSAWSSYFKFSIERNPWDRQVSWCYWRTRGMAEPPTFEAFLRMPKAPIVRNWEVYAVGDQVAVDRVLRFENLGDEFADVLKEIGVRDAPELGAFKAGIRPQQRSYRSYYTDQTRSLVADWYKREINQLGYEF